MSFTGKTAIITGGGSGIGRACALGLGKLGARVAVWDVNRANAASVALRMGVPPRLIRYAVRIVNNS